LTKNDGGILDISLLQGKKTVIVFMQTNLCDSLWINEYESFTNRFYSKINMIVIPIINKDGFQSKKEQDYFANEERSSKWIRIKSVYLKDGNIDMEQVSEYFINRKKNKHFQKDVILPGDKYFLDEAGELYAVVGSQVSLNSENIFKILERKVASK
jgi:glutathione peroxidase